MTIKAFDTILVAVDFSPASLAAARHACALAGPTGTVRLLRAIDTEVLHRTYLAAARNIFGELVASLAANARQRLAELARDLAPQCGGAGPRIETQVVLDRPACGILDGAEKAGLLVVGAHAQGMVQRFFLGSVAEEVVRRSPIPTLVVREGADGPTKVGRVLVAVDLDEPSPEVLAAADQLARRVNVPLIAVHVVPWPILPGFPGAEPALANALYEAQARIRDEAPGLLRKAVEKVLGHSCDVIVKEGAAAEGIIEVARPDDVLVCGTHGRGALGRLAFGSVATRLVRRAPCPVLVVRPALEEGS